MAGKALCGTSVGVAQEFSRPFEHVDRGTGRDVENTGG